MLKGFAFDLGNTLVNDAAALEAAVGEMDGWLLARGAVQSPGAFAQVYLQVNRKAGEPFISHTYGEPSFFAETFRLLGVVSVSPQEALEVYRGLLMRHVQLEQPAREGLCWLRARGLKTALLTNESVARVEAFLQKTGSGDAFDEVVVSEAVGWEKPAASIFREALRRLGLRGPEMVMLGDNPVADGACRELGIRFVLVKAFRKEGWGWERGAAYEPEYVLQRIDVPSLRGLLGALDPDGETESRRDSHKRPEGGHV